MAIEDILATGAQWLIDKLQDVAARSVVFTRDQLTSDAIIGTPTKITYTVMDDDGFMTEAVAFDWRFETVDLVLRDEAFTPRPGDRIEETLNGQTVQYEVVRIKGRPASEWDDTSGLMTMVHTRRIE